MAQLDDIEREAGAVSDCATAPERFREPAGDAGSARRPAVVVAGRFAVEFSRETRNIVAFPRHMVS